MRDLHLGAVQLFQQQLSPLIKPYFHRTLRVLTLSVSKANTHSTHGEPSIHSWYLVFFVHNLFLVLNHLLFNCAAFTSPTACLFLIFPLDQDHPWHYHRVLWPLLQLPLPKVILPLPTPTLLLNFKDLAVPMLVAMKVHAQTLLSVHLGRAMLYGTMMMS